MRPVGPTLAALAVLACPPPALAQTGTVNWLRNPISGNWVGKTNLTQSFTNAKQIAASLGGYLITIRSIQENDWAETYVRVYSGEYGEPRAYWLGLNDMTVKGTWEWASGEPVVWTNWLPGQPIPGDAAELIPKYGAYHGGWGAVPYSRSRRALVELTSLPWKDWMPPQLFDSKYPAWGFGDVGDLDGDGDPDIVFPETTKGLVHIALNDGNGWYTLGQPATGFHQPVEARIVDYDRDGRADMVVADLSSQRGVGIAFGDGVGGFGPFRWWAPGNWGSRGLAVGDLDGDGFPDVAASEEYTDRVNILFNDQARWFKHTTDLATLSQARFITIGDLDGDGLADIVTTEWANSSAGLFYGWGNRTFLPRIHFPTSPAPRRIELDDMDQDGLPEMLFALGWSTTGSVAVYKRLAGGSYSRVVKLDALSAPEHAASADFNLDGIPDILCQSGGRSEIYHGRGNWKYDPPLDLRDGYLSGRTVIADIAGDRTPGFVSFGYTYAGIRRNLQHDLWTLSPVNGHWYRPTLNFSWPEAEAMAVSWGGHLATVRSRAENDWLKQTMAIPEYSWIGYTDQVSEGTFLWSSGEPVGFELWGPGQPDDLGGADWVAMSGASGAWSDEPAAKTFVGIAEVISPDCDGNGRPDLTEILLDASADWNGDRILDDCLSPNYCGAVPNSSGAPGIMVVEGAPLLSEKQFTLRARQLPKNEWGYFLMSPIRGFIANPGGSAGNLCLGSPLYRFIGPGTGKLLSSGIGGQIALIIDFTKLPQGVAYQPGETWNYQAWFRDGNTSNFTDGIEVMWR